VTCSRVQVAIGVVYGVADAGVTGLHYMAVVGCRFVVGLPLSVM
jgi:hypothetical protein